jgi:hypothetical protein
MPGRLYAAAQTLGEVVDDREGQMILDLRVLRSSRVWDGVHQRYLASQALLRLQRDRRSCGEGMNNHVTPWSRRVPDRL